MSDFWKKAAEQNNIAEDVQKNNFWKNEADKVEQNEIKRLENRKRYGVELSDDEYAQISGLIADSDNQTEEAHKLGSAILFSKQTGIPLAEAYSNLDSYQEALFDPQQITNYRSGFIAIKDMFVMGTNNVRIGQIGQQLKRARKSGNTELAETLQNEYKALMEDNAARQDNAPRSWTTRVLKDGAQSLPYTAYAAGAAMFGSFIAPIAGTAAAFLASSDLMAGQEYLDLLDKGVRPEIAEPVSNISGGLQGLVEAALGEVMSWAGSGAHLMGQKVIGKELRNKLTDKIAESVQRKFHFGTGSKLATKLISDYLLDLPEEGAEEFVQEEISQNLQNIATKKENTARREDRQTAVELDRIAGLITDEVAEELIKTISEQMPELDTVPQKEIFSQSLEAFKGGVMGAIALGIVPGAANGIATARDYHTVKEFVKETPSEAMVQEFLDNTDAGQKVKESFTEAQQETLAKDLVEEFASRNEQSVKEKEISEVTASGEGYEEAEVTEEKDDQGNVIGETEAASPAYRNKDGTLETENVTISEAGQSEKKQYKVYDPTKEGQNLYGTISFDINENENKITITDFDMASHREGLRQEFYDKFAREYAGYNIDWNVIGERAKGIKENLIAANPNGRNNGLSYYNLDNINADFETRKNIARQLKSVYSGDYSDEQISQHVAFLESAFNSLKRNGDIEFNSLTDFINDTFQNGQVVQSADSGIARGGFIAKNLEKNLKAAIYVSQNGNFTTFTHEVSHLYRSMLQGEHLAEVSEAFGVQKDENGNYNWTRKDEERLAYGLEDYLATGRAVNEVQKKWYDKLCDFMAGALSALHNFVNFTPEIEKVYKDMLEGGNGNTLAAAYQAVKDLAAEEQKAVQEKKEAEETEQKQKAQQEEAAQNKEERRDSMDILEEQTAANDQDFPLSELEEEQIKTEKLADEIIQDEVTTKLRMDGLTDEEAQEVADVLLNGNSTLAEKIETVVDATAEDQEEEVNLDEIFGKDGLFQLIGELGASNLDRMEEVTTRIDNKKIAEEMEKAGKDVKAIRYATGWEKGVDGKWRYETNDLLNKFDLLNKVLDFEKRNPKYKEYSEKLWKSYDGGPELTEAEIQEFDALADEANAYYDKKDVKLKDILDAPELYAAYPKLKEMDVKFVNDPLNTTKASYATGRDLWTDAEIDFIQINNIPNSINEKEYESILLHELQHAIQRIEGFATGGSVQELVQNYKSKIHARMNEAYKEYYLNDELKNDYDEYKRLFNKVAEASNDDFMAALDELIKFEDSHENVRNFNKELEQARKDLHLENNMEAAPLFNGRITDTYYNREYSEIVKKLAEDYYNLSAFDDYKALAGEVEARNVQKRINMSPAERLETLLSDTEDVARDQQIVMFEAMRMAAEEEEQLEQTEAERQEEAVRKQYENTDKWMKAPNGEDTNLSEKQWLQVRTPNFKRWFGNWELGNKQFNIVQLEKAEFNNKSDGIKWCENNGIIGLMSNEDTGGKGKIDISKKSIDEMLNESQRKKSPSNDIHYAALTKIRDIIRESEIIENHPDFLKGKDGKRSPLNGINKDVNIDVLYGAISYEGITYRVKTTVKRYINRESKAYAYSVEKIEVLPGTLASERISSPKGNTSITGNSLLQGVYKVNQETGGNGKLALDDYSKILDENGEPLVVYHGSDQDFTVFDASKSRANMDIQGNFFSPWEMDAQGYGSTVRAFFLNIKNPASEQVGYKALRTFTGQNEAGIKARELLKSQGYDGVNNENEEYIAFNPNQIKSATDNNGNFDENNPDILFQRIDDPEELERLNNEETVKAYSAMQVVDGEFFPPMAKKIGKETVDGAKPGDWFKSDEHQEIAYFHTKEHPSRKFYSLEQAAGETPKLGEDGEIAWFFDLKKDGKDSSGKPLGTIEARFNPYWHSTKASSPLGVLNDQFSSAYKRPNIVIVEVEIPLSDINSGYKAEKAKDAVGELSWHEGPVSSRLKGTPDERRVILSRYKKIVRALSNEEVANLAAPGLINYGITVPDNTMTPGLINELAKHGVTIERTQEVEDYNKALADKNSIDGMLYQTMDELYADARMYETWQDFMEAYTTDFNPEAFSDPNYHNQVPGNADAQWYQTTWELAHNLKPEESLNEEEIKEKAASDGTVAAALDAMFTAAIATDEKMLDDFLVRVAEIESIDLGSEEYSHPQDEEEEAELHNIERLQDFIETQLNHGNWISNAKRVRRGDELTTTARKRIISLMRAAPRDYRAIYAEVMGDETYAVDEQDKIANQLEKRAKLTKYKAADPNSNFERMSPEQRRKIAEEMDNEDIARKVRNGTLHLDDEIEHYIKSLDAQIKDANKNIETLEKETQEDYRRISDWQKRRLLELNDRLNIARSKLTKKNSEISSLIDKGVKISSKYQRDAQNMKANYDEIFRKFEDLRSTIRIDVQVEEALKRQDMVYKAKEDLNSKNKEKSLAAEVKKLRIGLVKRTMRRVPFNRIDYESARTLIAIQRIFEPNLMGGVNRFIGQDSPFLRGVISEIITDSDYKKKLLDYLRKTARGTQANKDFIEKLENLKSLKDFEAWTKKERDYAIRKLPKENWIRDLNLNKLAEEREESIDLDIEMKEKQRAVIDPKTGEVKKRADGSPVKETTFELEYSDELGALVKDAIGADMFNRLVNVPFADWTTEELEALAVRVNEIYTEGRDNLQAKRIAKKEEAAEIRKRIEDAAKNTGIIINDDDTPEEKERKQKKIDRILGINDVMKGTQQANEKKQSRIKRLLHGYADANVRRVARILDNYSEGENTNELYWKENEAYNSKTRSMNERAVNINNALEENGITMEDLETKVKSETAALNEKFTVDELLYILAADKDFMAKEGKEGSTDIDDNDDFAPTSRNAVMFGNIMSETENTEWKESLTEEDRQLADAIENGTLTAEQEQALILGQLEKTPGTGKYIAACHAKYEVILGFAQNFLNNNPKYQALMDVISSDYASQYDRMNEISIKELNSPVHRTKCYVPLVRMESNGDTNANKVKEDLLATMGGQSKQWVNKGMTQRRVSMSPLNQKPVQMGLYKTWADSVERTEHFIAYAGYVRELNQVYKSRDAAYTRQFIENRYGKPMISYIDDYINEVANPNANRVRSAADELMHTLRGKTAPAYLAWKASSIIKQAATSPWPYMQFVNPASYLNACFKCLQPGTYDAIRAKSVFMNNRRFDPMADLVGEMEDKARNKFEHIMAKQSEIGMSGLEWIDWVAVAPGWLACYNKKYTEMSQNQQQIYEQEKARLTEENMYAEVGTSAWMTKEQIEAAANEAASADIEKAAVDYADDCVRLCQPSNRNVDIAPLFKNNSEAWKAYLQFQTSLNVIWQNIRYDIPYAVRQKQFKQVAGIILGYAFAGIAMNSLMEGVTAGDDDDDEELATIRKQIYNATTQFTDSVPLIGSALTSADQKLITGKGSFLSSGEDMTPMVTKFLNVISSGAKAIGEADEEKSRKAWQKAATSFGEGVGMYLGLPVQGAKELGKVIGIGDGDGSLGINLSEIADNELMNAIDSVNPLSSRE